MTLDCRIRVRGHLSEAWSDWFGGLAISNLSSGEAELVGALPDAAALYGVIDRLRDLGVLPLALSVVERDETPRFPKTPGETGGSVVC